MIVSYPVLDQNVLIHQQDQQYFCSIETIDVWHSELKSLIANFDQAYRHYDEMTGIVKSFGQDEFFYTSLKIQKTLPGEGYHIWHCEHASRDTGQRCILAMAYLNTVAEGGETEFLYQSKRVPAVQGNIMFCPAGYTHTHRGNPPLTGDKYCITTWLEFTH